MASTLWPSVQKIFNPVDIIIFSVLYIIHKPLLKLAHEGILNIRRKLNSLHVDTKYSESLLGYIEKPISVALMFLPFVYSLDLVSIALHAFGFDFHVKGDISRLLCVIYEATTAGMFVTKMKDFFLNLHRLKKFQQNQLFHKNNEKVSALRRDEIREGLPVHAYISINLEFDDRISIFITGALARNFRQPYVS